MPYNFDEKLKQPHIAQGTQNRRQSSPTNTREASLVNPSNPTTMPHTAIRIEPEKQLIFGEDVWINHPPTVGSRNARSLFVDFPSPTGQHLRLDEETLSKHLLLLGGIGSGKTNAFNFILSDLLRHQSSQDIIFVFDTKGDYFERFYNVHNPGHIVIGNAVTLSGTTRFWNVFGELEDAEHSFGREGEFCAKEIAKQLFMGMESEHSPFFSMAAADLVAKVLIDFEREAGKTGDRTRLNNAALVNWFKRADLLAYVQMIERNPDFANAMLYIGDPERGAKQRLTGQALGVFAYINLMQNDLLHGAFASHVPRREFSMRNLVRDRGRDGNRTVVFVEYDLGTGEVLAPMYRLLFDLALKEALGGSRNLKGNVVFVIDEFKLLPNLIHIDDALNFGRSLGVKVFAGLQSINQLMDIYGEDRARSILSGFMNSFCFQASDSNTREYVCERFGENRYQLVYRPNGEYQSVQAEGHAVEDWDVRSMPVGSAAVDLLGAKPFVFHFAKYPN